MMINYTIIVFLLLNLVLFEFIFSGVLTECEFFVKYSIPLACFLTLACFFLNINMHNGKQVKSKIALPF